MPSYNSTARRPFATGGRVGFSTGGSAKKETRKEKKKRERKELSQQVSRETFMEAVGDWKKKKGKVHTTKRARGDTKERLEKLHRKQKGYFWPEKTLKKNFGEVRDKGWGGKHSTKVEHNAGGGKVGRKKPPKPKRIIFWKGKAKDWPGAQKAKERTGKAKGGKADKNWIQGVNKSIKKRGTKGVCTGKKFGGPTCRPGTKRYNLAKTFKKMARAKHASGGLVRFI